MHPFDFEHMSQTYICLPCNKLLEFKKNNNSMLVALSYIFV